MLNHKQRKYRFEALSQYGCCVCRRPAEIHHLIGNHKGMALKSEDEYTIPLCVDHHRGNQGIHQIGVETWESIYGSQDHHLELVNKYVKMKNGDNI